MLTLDPLQVQRRAVLNLSIIILVKAPMGAYGLKVGEQNDSL